MTGRFYMKFFTGRILIAVMLAGIIGMGLEFSGFLETQKLYAATTVSPKAGETVSFAGNEWLILDPDTYADDNATLVLSKEVIYKDGSPETIRFDKGDVDSTYKDNNYYDVSKARDWCVNTYYNRLLEAASDAGYSIKPVEITEDRDAEETVDKIKYYKSTTSFSSDGDPVFFLSAGEWADCRDSLSDVTAEGNWLLRSGSTQKVYGIYASVGQVYGQDKGSMIKTQTAGNVSNYFSTHDGYYARPALYLKSSYFESNPDYDNDSSAPKWIVPSGEKKANPLSFVSTQEVSMTYSDIIQSAEITKADGGVGEVTYSIRSQSDWLGTVDYFWLDSNTVLKAKAGTPAGTYTVVIRAAASGDSEYYDAEADSTVTVTVTKDQDILLDEAKENAKSVLDIYRNQYIDDSKYDEEGIAALDKALEDGKAAIDAAETAEEVEAVAMNAFDAMSAVKTKDQEPEENPEDNTGTDSEVVADVKAKVAAVEAEGENPDETDVDAAAAGLAALNDSQKALYGQEALKAAQAVVDNAKKIIWIRKLSAVISTISADKASELLAEYEKLSDTVKSLLNEVAEVKDGLTIVQTKVKESAKFLLQKWRDIKDNSDYDEEGIAALDKALEDGKAAIDAAETIKEVGEAGIKAMEAMDAVKTKARKAEENSEEDTAKTTPKLTLKTRSKNLKAKDLKKKKKTFRIKVNNTGDGKLTFTNKSAQKVKKKIKVSKAGKVTVKKGTRKGLYKVRVLVKAAATTKYNAAKVTKVIKVRVK